MSRPRVGIDARLFGTRDRGLGRYTSECLADIQTLQSDFEITVFVRAATPESAELQKHGWTVVLAPYQTYGIKEQIFFPKLIRESGVEAMFFPHFNVPVFCPVPYAVVVHDLILQHFPSRRASTRSFAAYWIKYCSYRLLYRFVLWRASRIVAVSFFTAEDLLTLYPAVSAKTVVLKERTSVLKRLGENDRNVVLSYNLDKPYVLVVGAFYPHKNISRLLRVWADLKTDVRLYFVGRLDAFGLAKKQEATQLGLVGEDSRVAFLGEVSDGELQILYREAKFVLVPSLYEGVGLPGLEALAADAAVVSSVESVLPETYQERVLYIPVHTDAAMKNALAKVLSSDQGALLSASEPRPNQDQMTSHTFRELYLQLLLNNPA